VNDVTAAADTKNRLVVYAKMWTSHASYDATAHTNNIALIYLPSDTYYSSNSAAAVYLLFLKDPTIDATFDANFEGITAKISGWGLEGNTGSPSNVLNVVTVTITSRATCSLTFAARTSKEICISDDSVDYSVHSNRLI
jgi:hypothetical protein